MPRHGQNSKLKEMPRGRQSQSADGSVDEADIGLQIVIGASCGAKVCIDPDEEEKRYRQEAALFDAYKQKQEQLHDRKPAAIALDDRKPAAIALDDQSKKSCVEANAMAFLSCHTLLEEVLTYSFNNNSIAEGTPSLCCFNFLKKRKSMNEGIPLASLFPHFS